MHISATVPCKERNKRALQVAINSVPLGK